MLLPSLGPRHTRLIAGLAVSVTLGACGDPTSGLVCEPNADGSHVQLVDHDLWALADAAADPFAAHRPADITCPSENRLAEDFAGVHSYAILTTNGCGYTTVTQPSLRDACAGETLYVWLWHFELTAPTPGTAHIAVHAGELPVWSVALPIPSASGLFAEEIPLPADLPAGTPITFHVRNHGANSYNLLEISVKR